MRNPVILERVAAPAIPTPEGAERRVLAHGGGMMLVEFTFPKSGIEAPMHSHPHEQLGYVKSGAIDLHMNGETTRLTEGGSYYVPPDMPHGVTILEPTVLVDAFTPRREDFLA
ncbi:cupin domain-containing protein [Roseobacter weihaiensis]|uniref:cupin domain-containing protein n=1 Tax=Roseobacter weihaiensis TaxID=2763262 RepID=UPI001D0B400C|nr:cupin domain-containing protein [Roseobacter sp. H9]